MKKIKTALPAIASVVLLYVFLYMAVIGCPIKFLTGISCPGCGMTRAYLSLLRLDVTSAFKYHPLWPFPALAVIICLFKEKIPKKIWGALLFTTIALFSIIYLLRLMDPGDEVVVFEPAKGAVYKGFHMLTGLMRG